MPEIAEVARVVHHLKKSLVGKTIELVKAQDDTNVFGKAGTTGAAFEKALIGKKVIDAGQQGKYFWLILSSPPHPVFHFGMTGWLYIRGEPSAHYRPKETDEAELWPPKFWKFHLQTKETPKVEAAFADARRFARVRLVDCQAEDIRKTTPLKENGPDPVIDSRILTLEWLTAKMKSKHVPVKALLLDQANISGIGNWVGDEILYHAHIHPEQYSDTFNPTQLKQLHTSIIYICETAVDLLADSSKFPEDWLFKHRWGKGKKGSPMTLPNGNKITFLTVGGRTSCVVPSVQKKTGAVAGEVKDEPEEYFEGGNKNGARKGGAKKRKTAAQDDEDSLDIKDESEHPKASKAKGRKLKTLPSPAAGENGLKEEEGEGKEGYPEKITIIKKVKREEKTTAKTSTKAENEGVEALGAGRRRSGRLAT